jgi:hypothetical protein
MKRTILAFLAITVLEGAMGTTSATAQWLVNLDPSGGGAGAGSTSIHHGVSLKF